MPALDYSISLVTAATEEPLTLAELKAHARIDDTTEDALLNRWIRAARREGEKLTRRQFCSATYDLKLDAFPAARRIELPWPPLVSVTSLSYVDVNGATQVWSSTNYEIDTARDPGLLWLTYTADWPTARDVQNAVTVRYVAGYGAASAVPEGLKVAIAQLASHWYWHRGEAVEGQRLAVPLTLTWLFDEFTLRSYP